MNYPYTLEVINLVLGGAIFSICFCRVVVSSKNVLGRVRLKYILMGPAALAEGLTPVWCWTHSTSSSEVFLMGAVLLGLMSETYQWNGGPPDSVKRDSMTKDIKKKFINSVLHRLTSIFHKT